MNNWWKEKIKPILSKTLTYILESKEEREANVVKQIRKTYESYGEFKLRDMLIAYKSQLKQQQFIFTGVMLVIFTALLGGLGKSIIAWINDLMIYSISSNAKLIRNINTSTNQMILFIDGFIVTAIFVILVLSLANFIDKIKFKQMKILILEDVIKKKAQNDK